MSAIATAVRQIAQILEDTTGIHATADPSKIVLPCVLVGPPELEFVMMGGGAQADFPVTLLAPAPWNLDALERLSDMLDQVLAVEGIVPPTTAKPGNYGTGKGADIPCYRVTYRMAVGP